MDETGLRALAVEGAKVEYQRLRARLKELEGWFPELRRAIRKEIFAANAVKARAARQAKLAANAPTRKKRAYKRRKVAG